MKFISPFAVFFARSLVTAWISMRALRRNAMRSSLTALGIIIGVASVVAMVAVGNGAQARIEGQVAALGQNMLMIFAGSRRSGGVHGGLGSARTMTVSDALAIERVHDVDDALAASVVVAPQCSNLVLAAHIPHSEANIFILNSFNVET